MDAAASMTWSAIDPTTMQFEQTPSLEYCSTARVMAGLPSIGRQTLWIDWSRIRVPLPAASMTETTFRPGLRSPEPISNTFVLRATIL